MVRPICAEEEGTVNAGSGAEIGEVRAGIAAAGLAGRVKLSLGGEVDRLAGRSRAGGPTVASLSFLG